MAPVAPTVVAWAPEWRATEGSIVAPQMAGWKQADVSTDHEIVHVLEGALRDGPVLYLPSWQDVIDWRRRDSLDRIKAIFEQCRPQADGHVLAVLMPESTTTGMRHKSLRLALTHKWQPTLVLVATGALEGIRPGFETACLFLSPKTSTWQPLKMFRVTHKEDPSKVATDFSQLLRQSGGQLHNGYILRQSIHIEDGLGYNQHDPKLLSRKADLTGFGPLVPLGEVFDIRLGFNTAVNQHILCSHAEGDAVRVMHGRDIGREGVIARPDEDSKWIKEAGNIQLQAGDLVMRAVQHPTDAGGFVVARVTTEHLPAVAAHTIIVLRPKFTNQHRLRLALLFLRSALARRLATANLSNSVHVTTRALVDLPVPQPDAALSQALDELDAAQQQFEVWRGEATELLDSVFHSDSATKAREQLVRSGQQLRLRADAAKLIDDFAYTIRTRFPYPIAFHWRMVEAALSRAANLAAYHTVLDCAEVLLWYAANLALLMAYRAGITVGALDAIRTKLTTGRGPGLGEWIAVLEEVARGRQFRRLPEGTALGEVRVLLGNEEASSARQRLTDRRNDEAHMRRVDPVNLPAALASAHADLAVLLRHAMFLADMPLIVVHEAHWDQYEDATIVTFGELMGDHAVVPSRTMRIGGGQIEQGSLYVLDRDRRPHLLRPYLVGLHCPQCGLWSTFGIDRWMNGRCIMKSLEHGHTMEMSGLADALLAVGFLS